MEPTIAPVRPDVAAVESAPRPTPTPVRVHFSDVLSASATNLVRGAEAAVSPLPGSPVMAVALRGGPGLPGGTIQARAAALAVGGGGGVTLAAEGPGASGASVGTGAVAPGIGGGFGGPTSGVDGGVESSLAQAQDMNLYYLQIQQAVDAQNRQFTMLSNVLKAEHDTAKSAIDNIHS